MKHLRARRLATGLLAALALTLASGCIDTTAPVTFLDVINTVLLGVTAAGGVVLIQNL
jgi:hypothetical protein